MGRTNSRFNALRDLVVLSAILAVANALLDRHDPGWMHLNPTPWLLPAALVGARYGFASGLLGGLFVAALLAFVTSRLQGVAWTELVRDNAYIFLSIAVTGAVAGEIGRLLGQRRAEIQETNVRLESENARLRHQLQLTDETRHQLQRQLVLLNAPLCALDEELRTLFTYPQEEFAGQVLLALHRLTGMTSAGIYLPDRGSLTRTAALHPTPPLAPVLPLDGTPLAEKALSSGALASVVDATELTKAQPFLAAFPWLDHIGMTHVLLVQDMPLEHFNLQNLARLELILSWASAIAILRQTFVTPGDRVHTIPNEDFGVLLSEALEVDRIHRLPSVVLRFDFDDAAGLRASLRRFPRTAIVTRLDGGNSVAALLPFAGESEARRLREEIAAAQPAANSRHLLVAGATSATNLWTALHRS